MYACARDYIVVALSNVNLFSAGLQQHCVRIHVYEHIIVVRSSSKVLAGTGGIAYTCMCVNISL